MGWGIGVGVGPLYWAKSLGGPRPGGSGGCGALLGLVILGLAIKYWYVVTLVVICALWLAADRPTR